MAESFSRQKSRHAPQKEGGLKILCDLPPVCVTPAGTSNELDVQNGWEENTHTHTQEVYTLILGEARVVVVVVVVDSHIQRIVLATEETTVTQQVSHRPIKRQSRLWSQRGTKVNGSHHGDNPLLRPTGIQIATKSYAALQAMNGTDQYQNGSSNLLTPFESNLDRLGMLSPTHDQRSQQKTGKITLQPVLINK